MLSSLDTNQRATVAYVAPFLAFVGLMALERITPLPPQWLYPLRFLIVATVIATISWPYLSLRPKAPLASIAIGLLVFVVWVAPDLLFGYRHHWLFENSVTGVASSSFSPHLKKNVVFMAIRFAGSALLVPILEELFWRGWMMRWLVDTHFLKVPLGTYTAFA